MMRSYLIPSVLTPLVLLTSVSFLHMSTSSLVRSLRPANDPHRHAPTQSENLVQPSVQEEQEELFKDVDPRTLAAVLLEALNHSRVEDKERNEGGVKDERGVEGAERHRDGRQELQMLIASQGKDQEREEEEKALEEEEKMTEKVTSRTTSQTIPIQTEQQLGVEAALVNNPEEEEQISPEELKSLETMMKEFPSLDTKTEKEPDQMHRENRAFSSYNDIIPIGKGSNLAMSKKKLKWQEETQKALFLPTFTGSNSLEEGTDREEKDEGLSPQEEEAQAKLEQEEMMRQAAEAQRAKLEEEKLADMASDMLLHYMVKENSRKYGSSPSNTAEDKRSEEELDQTDEDIDPQTIDKLIEISSKLHLPADDVVDIITDVEKKKKKDVPPEITSTWQRPPSPPSSSFLPGWQVETGPNSVLVSKQPFPAVSLLRSWFQKKKALKSEDSPRKFSKFWSRPEKTQLKSSASLWANLPYMYPPYHHRRVFPDYPLHVHPLPRPKSHYYPIQTNNFMGNSVDDTYTLQPRWYYPKWIHPQLRERPMSYYPPIVYPRQFLRAQPPPLNIQKQFYSSALGPRNRDYYVSRKPSDSSLGDVEKYIQQILNNRPQRMD